MAIQIQALLLLSFTLTVTVTVSAAGRHRHLLPTAPPPKPNATEQFLTTHNNARAVVHVANLTWSPALSSLASSYVRYQRDHKACAFADLSSSPYGANQAWASYAVAPVAVVAAWVEAGKFYVHGNNTCAVGKECGTYTQVVWRKTAVVGCAQGTCAKGATLTVCLYDPHGNVQGESPY